MIPIFNKVPDLAVHRSKKVVLWGAGECGQVTAKLFRQLDLPIAFICDSDATKWGTQLLGIPVVSPSTLETEEEGTCCIQISCKDRAEKEIEKQAETMGFSTVFRYDFVLMLLFHVNVPRSLEETAHPQEFLSEHNALIEGNRRRVTQQVDSIFEKKQELPIFVCIPPKAGDHTILYTLGAHDIKKYYTRHVATALGELSRTSSTIKIISGVREPIGSQLSMLFQHIDGNFPLLNANFARLTAQDKKRMKETWDLQLLYDVWNHQGDYVQEKQGETEDTCGHPFFDDYCKNVVDVFAHPFDQEKGYTIIKEGNVEIFLYQLEKLNDLLPEFSEFVGKPITAWEKGNEASGKWIAEPYKRAKQELKISQAVFDSAYDAQYIKHFYAPKDIEKFKEIWRKNIDRSK